jgi:Ca2+-binding RTX toxin-like protein
MPPTLTTTAPHTASVTLAATRDRQPEVSPSARAIAFIDSAVDDYPMLVDGVLPGIKVVVLSSDRDGIAQITETLQTLSGIASVYIVAHGAPGYLKLGNSELSLESCDRYASQLRTWFDTDDSQLLLYACNVAAGDAGAEFLAKLQGLVGGAIAASTHKVGALIQGGSWQLNAQLGWDTDSQFPTFQVLPFQTQVIERYQSVLATFTVTNTKAIGEGSLRQALLDANATPGVDTITFGGSTFTDNTPDTIFVVLESDELITAYGVTFPVRVKIGNPPALTEDVNIVGPGTDRLTIITAFQAGSSLPPVFTVNSGATVNISGITIAGERSQSVDGKGIYNAGNLTLTDVVVKDFTVLSGGSVGSNGGAGVYNVGTLNVVNSSIRNNSIDYKTRGIAFQGAGIYSSGTLNVVNSTISSNSTTAQGGGIYNSGTASITSSIISGNSVSDASFSGSASRGTEGAGIYNAATGTLAITNSSIVGNSSQARSGFSIGFGGGISNLGTVLLSNSTVAGNSADGNAGVGGGVNTSGTLTISNSTIAGNTGRASIPGYGATGGISGAATVQNSIIAGNVGLSPYGGGSFTYPDVVGSFTDKGSNLIGDSTGSTGFTTSVLVGSKIAPIDPKLGPGLLLPNSPAINAGSNSLIPADSADLDGDGNTTEPIPYDQRGTGFPRVLGGTVDIGAFEQASAVSINEIRGTAAADTLNGTNGDDSILGLGDRDTLIGNDGNDVLIGGAGGDTLTGGAGSDRFTFNDFSERTDRVTDFTIGADTIDLRGLFDALNYTGTNPIQDGYLKLVGSGTTTSVQIDPDGVGVAVARTLVNLDNTNPTSLNLVRDFVIQ